MRPELPAAARLADYLRQIDASRYYSNFGPFACPLEDRLAEHYGVGSESVEKVANATLDQALTLPAPGSEARHLYAMRGMAHGRYTQ